VYSRPADDASLFELYHARGDLAARDELIARHLPLVRNLARRYSYTSEPLDDLCQVGAMALLKAVERYRPERGASFRAYAIPTIVGELRRHFRDTGWALHVPRGLQDRAREAGAALAQLQASLGRSPTIAELAAARGVPREDVIEALDARLAYDATSLDGATRMGAEDERFEMIEYHAMLERTLRAMPARERRILHLRFSEDMSQAEIARRVGFSQMHVSRLLRRALERLRAGAGADGASFEREPVG
jgi:RNA polymerase sigma-B factor